MPISVKGPSGDGVKSASHCPHRTRDSLRSQKCRTSVVLPTPASPATNTNFPRASNAASSRFSSIARSRGAVRTASDIGTFSPDERWIWGFRRIYTGMNQKTGWVIALTAIGSLMAALDTLVVATALSTIRVDLGASVEALEWTVNAYNLSFAVLLITAAALGDRYGRRNLYAAGLAIFTVASALCALAPGAGTLIAARALQGVGAAFVMPLGLALLSAAFPPERRGAAIGIFSAITGLSVAAGPLGRRRGGRRSRVGMDLLAERPDRCVAIPLVLTRMRESHGPDTGLDLPGLALVTARRARHRVGPGSW